MKKFTSFIICIALLLLSSTGSFASEFDATRISLAQGPAMSDIVFTGETITLDLNTVIEHMLTTGTAIQTANINKESDKAIANGYSESFNTIQSTIDFMSTISLDLAAELGIAGSVSGIDARIIEYTKNFAKANLETNYQAELNSIKKSAVQLFYSTLQAQEYHKVALEDLLAKQTTLNNVQKKYNLGVASKLDLMKAQNALTSAESSLISATASYNAAKMNFNMQLGYPLMQEVVLTEGVQASIDSPIDLTAALASAKENRNEVKVVEFAFSVQEALYNNATLTTSQTSSAYQKQKVAYLQAKQSALQIKDQMEMDVKIKFMGIVQKRFALFSAENTVALTKESYRISQLMYNAGMNTLADLMESEVMYNQAKLGRISAASEYALALYDFEYASGVGTVRLAL